MVNSPRIFQEIAQMALQPMTPDEIFKFWKVYTTTQRMLKDPTAQRLENLFWRIWGSRKTKLGELGSAKIVEALIYISSGCTAAGIGPLRSVANRDESGVPTKPLGPRVAPKRLKSEQNHANGATLAPPKSSFNGERHKKKDSQELVRKAQRNSAHLQMRQASTDSAIVPDEAIQPQGSAQQSSKTLITPLPPILKKARGPSSSGPRPTARFVSPTQSENEYEDVVDDDHDEESESGPNSNVMVRPPTPDEQPSNTHKVRTHVAIHRKARVAHGPTSKMHKKRPTLGKRPSSQSSVGSTGSDSAGVKQDSEPQDVASPSQETKVIPAQATGRPRGMPRQQSIFRENFSPEDTSPGLSMLDTSRFQHLSTEENGAKSTYVSIKGTATAQLPARDPTVDRPTMMPDVQHKDERLLQENGRIDIKGKGKASEGSDIEHRIASTTTHTNQAQPQLVQQHNSTTSTIAPAISSFKQNSAMLLGKRSSSAMNLSAALASNHRGQYNPSTQVSRDFASPIIQNPSVNDARIEPTMNGSTVRKSSGVLPSLDWPGAWTKTTTDSSTTMSTSLASGVGESFKASRNTNRSVSNLSQILQRDEAAKQRRRSSASKK